MQGITFVCIIGKQKSIDMLMFVRLKSLLLMRHRAGVRKLTVKKQT